MPPSLPTGTKEVEPAHRLDEAKLADFLRRSIDEFEGPLTVRQFRGGQSNPTYELTSPEGRWVLRRKPPGKLVRGAHAVDREFRVLSALQKVGYPAPRPRVLCEDDSVIGTMFYVMDAVAGRIVPDPLLPGFEPDERRQVYDSLNERLAQLHGIDYEAIGLGDYGRPGNYFARQIRTWSKQIDASQADRVPELDRLVEWLPNNIPDEGSTSISHGDFGLNNVLLHPTEPRVAAVLDWELSTIGHPLADLTYLLSQRYGPTSGFRELGGDGVRELGIPSDDEYIALYCECTGRAGIDQLEFYYAFHCFRTAGIMQGIAGRVKAGTAAGEGAAELGKLVKPLAERGLEFASKLGA